MLNLKNAYDLTKLKSYCDENNITLLDNYENKKVTRDVFIKANCITLNCNNDVNKTFRRFVLGGCYCNVCTRKLMNEKIKLTCLQKYGVDHYFKDKNIAEKKNQTYIKNYGLNDPTKFSVIVEKRKNKTNVFRKIWC